jgi:hypothetical protein
MVVQARPPKPPGEALRHRSRLVAALAHLRRGLLRRQPGAPAWLPTALLAEPHASAALVRRHRHAARSICAPHRGSGAHTATQWQHRPTPCRASLCWPRQRQARPGSYLYPGGHAPLWHWQCPCSARQRHRPVPARVLHWHPGATRRPSPTAACSQCVWFVSCVDFLGSKNCRIAARSMRQGLCNMGAIVETVAEHAHPQNLGDTVTYCSNPRRCASTAAWARLLMPSLR